MNENTNVNLNTFKEVMEHYSVHYGFKIMYDFMTPDGEEGQDFANCFDAYTPEEMESFTITAVYVKVDEVWYNIKFSNLDDIEQTVAIVECYQDYLDNYLSEERWEDIFEHFENHEIINVWRV